MPDQRSYARSTLLQLLSAALKDAGRSGIGDERRGRAVHTAVQLFREAERLRGKLAIAEAELATAVRLVPQDDTDFYVRATGEITEQLEEFIYKYLSNSVSVYGS